MAQRFSSFETWLKGVDHVIGSITGGLSHRDIADQTWHDWFDAEYTPRQAAREALESEGFPF
ncbi:hypothetical protein 40AC_87 [Mycobacterium phage 40AC]|uniref:Uncharacterized protein n=1 Tax=Mycobacterium phage 40AC TaxID=1458717 RepID=W8EHN8_9CAUD|nr:hypothetical protein ST40AC_87 [Mycobacterium phage 40AC]AHJ86450.1 hypothetical protein 40AC_87 [Mycobacterium phage 40AC]